MATQAMPAIGTFTAPRKTATGGTAFAQFIPPFHGTGANLGTGVKGVVIGSIIHLQRLIYDIGTTGHLLSILRPLNYTTFSAAAAASQAVVSLTADPGVYSTNFKYPVPNGQAVRTADDPIASGDYVMYQASDGTWILDTAAGSYSAGSLTLTTNLPTGGVLQGGLFYYFGIAGDIDPSTGIAQPQFDILAAGSGTSRYDTAGGEPVFWSTLHPGDPMVIYSPNTTAQGWLQMAGGIYAKL